MQDCFGIKGSVCFEHRKADGTLVSRQENHNLVTNAGWDWLYNQMSGTVDDVANYIALTADAGPASAEHTTLASEYVDFGLERAVATPAHTPSAKTYTLTKVFTCDTDTKLVSMAGLFNAAAVGIMVLETVLTSPTTLMDTDTLTVTWTITMGT